MSNATSGIVEDIGLSGVRLHEIGEHWLKDMERPQRLVQLDVEGLGSTAAFAVRLCMTTEPGQILLSHVTEALLEGEVRAFELADLGTRPVVPGSRPEHVFMVVSREEAEPGLR